MRSLRAAFLALLPTVLLGCPPPVGPDAGSPDVYTPYTSPLFARCRDERDCTTGNKCLKNTDGYPGGFCTRTCESSFDCETGRVGVTGECREVNGENVCVRYCENGFDCGRQGYTCTEVSSSARVCTPSCSETNCGEGATCDLSTGRCVATGTPLATGADNGEPCTASGEESECKSQMCQLARNARGTYTGWNNGACVSICSMPTGWASNGFVGTEIPRSNCPQGSICYPGFSLLDERDPGLCITECRSDSECRTDDGYYCAKQIGTRRYTNGVCVPVDCVNDDDHPCPSGYMCQSRTASGRTTGTCVPATVRPDAGPEAGTDAATDVQQPVDVQPADVTIPDVSTVDAEIPDSEADAAVADAGIDASAD